MDTQTYVVPSGAGAVCGAGAAAAVAGATGAGAVGAARTGAGVAARRPVRALVVCGLVLLLAALLAGVGGTWALANSAAEHADLAEYFDAKLSQHYADEPVAAYPGFTAEQSAAAENTGSKDMWVRMSLDKYWMEKDGDAWKRVDDSAGFDSDYIIVHMNEDAWTQGDDGWWYCNEAVAPGATSADLFNSIEISTETGEEVQGTAEKESMYALHAASVDVKMECTAAPDPQADGAQAKFGKTADTSDALPWGLLLAAAAMLAAAIVFLVAAWRRRRGKDDAQVVELTL